MKSFHLSGPKFDIAVGMFYMVEFSNSLLGQKFVVVKFKFEFCEGCPPLAMPNGTNIPVSHIILYELSDCVLCRQTNGTL